MGRVIETLSVSPLEPLMLRAVQQQDAAVTEFGRHIYRPWAYARGLNDFGLADSVGNLGGIVVQVFVSVALFNATRQQSFRLAAFLSVGFIAYEFAQPYLPKGVFDWRDVAATALGFALSCVLLWIIWRLLDTRNSPSTP